MADWSGLVSDLLFEIAGRITSYEDLIAFGGVCTSWRGVAAKEKFRFKSVPWLMLTPKQGSLREFFSPPGNTSQVVLPEVQDKKYFSSQGWLLTIGKRLGINLLHPFSHIQIRLPHMKTIKNWKKHWIYGMCSMFIQKCLLSSRPLSKSDCIVTIIYGDTGRLGYCRPGDESWSLIETGYGCCFDINFFQGRFYAIKGCGDIITYDIPAQKSDVQVTANKVAEMPPELFRTCFEYLYIVGSGGSLLVVARLGVQSGETRRFRVFEVDIPCNQWTEVESLGNRALFLGNNSSVSLEVGDNPPVSLNGWDIKSSQYKFKPNCIYFTDDYRDGYLDTREGGGKDMGIYSMQYDSVESYFNINSRHRINPPMWVLTKLG